MRKFLSSALFLIGVSGCAIEERQAGTLTAHEKDLIVKRMVRYVAPSPENVSGTARFLSKYDDYYQQKLTEMRLEQHSRHGDEIYFMVFQPSPSLRKQWVATGGKFTWNEQGHIINYEEVFRTWKMDRTTLMFRGHFLYDKMVAGESLVPYYTKNTNGVDYIELPDSRTYFDVASGSWKLKGNFQFTFR